MADDTPALLSENHASKSNAGVKPFATAYNISAHTMEDQAKASSDNQHQGQLNRETSHRDTTGANISELRSLLSEAYGGGLYGTDDVPSPRPSKPASDSQSAEGPPTTTPASVHAPPSTGDRDLDITGQSYIQ